MPADGSSEFGWSAIRARRIHCYRIESVTAATGAHSPFPEMLDNVRYSIVNEKDSPFSFTQSTAWIKFNLVVEVIDQENNLVLRQDYEQWANPSDSSVPVKVSIPAKGRVTEEFAVWLCDVSYGRPQPGLYKVRLLFPFERRRFYSSNIKEFKVGQTM